MPKNLEIRYGKLWVRLLCCLAVAVGVWRAFDLVALRFIEQIVYSFLLAEFAFSYESVADWLKTSIVFIMSLGPALIRVDRPLVLVVCNLLFGLAYFTLVVVALFEFKSVLPVSAPFLGLVLSTIVLDTMAWTEERSRRRYLERMEIAKQNFTDMLVHDLTNRVSSIAMSFSLLEKHLPEPDEKTGKLLKTIRSSTKRLRVQINALLDIRKIQEGKMTLKLEKIRLTDFLLSAIEEFQPAAEFVGIRMKMVSPEDVSRRITIDRDIFSRVMANLFWNALQHAPVDSDVEIGYDVSDEDDLKIFVGNHGPVIPPAEKEVIFDKFVSGKTDIKDRKVTGTGLGLSFCKLAVEAHQGTISVESPWGDYDDGVRVDIRMPGPDAEKTGKGA